MNGSPSSNRSNRSSSSDLTKQSKLPPIASSPQAKVSGVAAAPTGNLNETIKTAAPGSLEPIQEKPVLRRESSKLGKDSFKLGGSNSERVDEFLRNRERALSISYILAPIRRRRRVSKAATTLTKTEDLAEDRNIKLLKIAIQKALTLVDQLVSNTKPGEVVLAEKGKERSAHSAYVLQFADLDKRFQHIDLADDFTVLDMALPENQIVNYISTAYAYHHVLNKTLLPVETLQRLLDVIETASQSELLDQIKTTLHSLPRQTYAELKFSVGHLVRISRLSVLDCIPGIATLFTSPMIEASKDASTLNKLDLVKMIFITEISELNQPAQAILQLLMRYFMELFSSQAANEDTAKWRGKVTTLQEAGGESLGLSAGTEGWKEALSGERKLRKNGGSMYL